MGEPALNKYDDENDAPSSAYERAKKQWGMGDDAANEEDSGKSDTANDGDSSARSRADKKWGMSPGQLAEAEGVGATARASGADASEKSTAEALDEEDGGWFKDDGKPSRRFRLTRKQAAGGGIVGLLVAGGFWGFSILQGPLQLIHIAQLLQNFHFSINEEANGSRIGRVYEYFRTGNDPSKRNLGYIGEKLSAKYLNDLSADGISVGFEDPSRDRLSRRIQTLTIDLDNPKGKAAFDRLRADGLNISDDGVIDLRGDGASARTRRRALFAAVDIQGKGRVSAAVSKRLLALRAGVDFHPLKNIRKDSQERFIDFIRDRRDERSERNKNGVDLTDGIDDAKGESEPDPDNPDGDPIENPSGGAAADGANGLADEAADATTPDLRRSLASRLAGGGAAVIGLLCMTNAIGDSIPEYQRANIIMPMLRMSMEMVAIGSQVQTGQDVNLDELGAVASTLYDEDTQSSFMGARAMQAVSGEELTGPDTAVKPSAVGEKPQIFDIIDSIPVLGTACTIQDAGGNFLRKIPVIGGGISAIENGFVAGVDAFLGTFSDWTMADLMERVVAIFAGDLVDTYAQGAELGNIAGIGGRLAANDAAIATGGRALSTTEFAQIQDARQLQLKQELEEKTFLARTFDLSSPDSLVARAIVGAPNLRNAETGFSNIARLPLALPSMITNSFVSLFPSAQAQSSESYDFGVEAYGFSQAELEDEDYADPYEIADYVEGPDRTGEKLRELNNKYGGCFANQVDPDNNYRLVVGETPSYDDVRKPECNDGSQDLKYYRYYLLDMTTLKSMACFEEIEDRDLSEASCQELGISPSSSTSSAPVSGGASPGQDTSGQTCAIGQDAGIGTTPDPGVNIRLCNVGGIVVNVAIERNTAAVINGGATAGLTFGAKSSYRSYEEQVALRREHCGTSHYDIYEKPAGECDPPTAIPGRSLHEWGLAIDFTCSGTTVSSGDPCFNWLESNQGQHNLINLPSEPWHWSSTGS